MDTPAHVDRVQEKRIHDGETGAAGLMALVVVLILTVCTAAALLLTLPQTFDGAAVAAAAPQVNAIVSAEPTFHERYPVTPAVGGSPEIPTF